MQLHFIARTKLFCIGTPEKKKKNPISKDKDNVYNDKKSGWFIFREIGVKFHRGQKLTHLPFCGLGFSNWGVNILNSWTHRSSGVLTGSGIGRYYWYYPLHYLLLLKKKKKKITTNDWAHTAGIGINPYPFSSQILCLVPIIFHASTGVEPASSCLPNDCIKKEPSWHGYSISTFSTETIILHKNDTGQTLTFHRGRYYTHT